MRLDQFNLQTSTYELIYAISSFMITREYQNLLMGSS